MKRCLLVFVACLLAAVPALSQAPIRLFTRPQLPPREVLNRLGMKLAWSARLPVEGQRDGIESIQLLPSESGRDQLLVQTLRGLVILLDADTGDTFWRTYVGLPYDSSQPAGYNEENIYVTRKEQAYVLKRANGEQRLYTVDSKGHVVYGVALQTAPTTAPTADEDAVFFVRDVKVTAYLVPNYRVIAKAEAEAAAARELPPPLLARSSPPLQFIWNALTYGKSVLTPALVSKFSLAVTSSDGTFIAFNKFDGTERFRYRFQGTVSAPMGQYGPLAYVGSEDSTLYALDMDNGRLVWRFQAGGPISLQPWVTAQDVFVYAGDSGLFRVDRDSGVSHWRNPEARRFLATNGRFVYASDKHGNFLVLDYLRGTRLASYDTGGFTVKFSNDQTDRVYLAAHDGTLICMHHRDHAAPLRARPIPRKVIPVEPKKEDLKKEEPKKDEDKAGWLRERQPGQVLPAPPLVPVRVVERSGTTREGENSVAPLTGQPALVVRPWRERDGLRHPSDRSGGGA